jgi:hypothetical protein
MADLGHEPRTDPPTPYDVDPPLFRVVDEHPYLDREDEFPGLGLSEACGRMEDLTGVSADVILADIEEFRRHGDPLTWEWTDDETGREVTLREEVS